LLPEDANDFDFKDLVSQADKSGSGKISYNDFMVFIIAKLGKIRIKFIREVHKAFDTDGNGFISVDEIKAAFKSQNAGGG